MNTLNLQLVNNPLQIAHAYYAALRKEVTEGNPWLTADEQRQLQSHYDVMMDAVHNPPELAATIYSSRRAPAVRAIREGDNPIVFDAGCGYGSESFLFAALGAKVLAVDRSTEQIAIARKRQQYYENLFARPLAITFVNADLNRYTPQYTNLSLTWLASVLAAIPDQDGLLTRIHCATRDGGQIMITDMNLLNPLFLINEWRRRQRNLSASPEFARHANFAAMLRRKERTGARYFERADGTLVDDVQFFTTGTLSRLLRKVGFVPLRPAYSGWLPPRLYRPGFATVETAMNRVPVLRSLAYFYLVTGQKLPQ